MSMSNPYLDEMTFFGGLFLNQLYTSVIKYDCDTLELHAQYLVFLFVR